MRTSVPADAGGLAAVIKATAVPEETCSLKQPNAVEANRGSSRKSCNAPYIPVAASIEADFLPVTAYKDSDDADSSAHARSTASTSASANASSPRTTTTEPGVVNRKAHFKYVAADSGSASINTTSNGAKRFHVN